MVRSQRETSIRRVCVCEAGDGLTDGESKSVTTETVEGCGVLRCTWTLAKVAIDLLLFFSTSSTLMSGKEKINK